MDIVTTLATDLSEILGLESMPQTEREEFLDSLGEVVFESAVLDFLNKVDVETQSVFSAWIQAHTNDEFLLENLTKNYPTFEKILKQEISNFKADARRIATVGSGS